MEKLSNPTLIKKNLITASLFMTCFELLKSAIEDRIKGLFSTNTTLSRNGEFIYKCSNEYKTEVLNRNIPNIDKRKQKEYHLFYSSCLWLKDNNVITQDDIEELEKIRRQRNLIAHQLTTLLLDDYKNINIELLRKSQLILSKIEKWWIIGVEIQVNPDYRGQEINESEVQSGRMIILDYLLEIAKDEIAVT
jgi:uncharacterized protein YutE (UPF0331/DUF86 family)